MMDVLQLYNPQPTTPRVIAIVNGTYSFIHKSSNFRTLRQTYDVHKGRHLVKPYLIVAPDGYILAIQGPYFCDSRDNDAAFLQNDFEIDAKRMRHWFQEDDVVIVDRGYQDAVELLQRLGIVCKITAHLERGESQITTENANALRIITKQRWVVEAQNGHIKSIFKFFDHVLQIRHIPDIGDFYRIAGAIINRYHPPLIINDAKIELARCLIENKEDVNIVQALVEEENLHTRNAQRFQNATKYQLWVAYRSTAEEVEEEEETTPIEGYYFTCKSGARTIGTCTHTTSVILYIVYARHNEDVHYPSSR
ncbi:hypothetical protein FQA39_LY10380 [Lamprigera yunnana]|nr:hypothetical protein FQA39_LY10380 [Lamprigera yunnana]